MGITIMIGQLMLSLMILVVLHEMGHFLPARWFKTRVDKFYIFFDPWFSVFKKKIGDTEYGIGWLPLGGYVKIAGMVDESMDIEQLSKEPQPWEFRSKKAWQRLTIMLGGVTVNFILGFFLFGIIMWVWGEEYMPAKEAKYGIYAEEMGKKIGLKDGDQIVKIGNTNFERFNDRILIKEVILNNARSIVVNRNGNEEVLTINETVAAEMATAKQSKAPLFGPRFPFTAEKILDGSPAAKAGIQQNDRIIALNNESTPYFNDFQSRCKALKSVPIELSILRGVDTISIKLTTTAQGTVGVYPKGPNAYFKTERQEYSLGEAFPAGIKKGVGFLGDQFAAFGQMFKGKIKASESLGGFGSIGSMFGREWIWERFWNMTAILSLVLAVMNLLPIPGLDGGYVVFLLFEMITGIKPSDKFMERAVSIGFFLLLALMIYANGLDIFRSFSK